jgi:hypothetical protein
MPDVIRAVETSYVIQTRDQWLEDLGGPTAKTTHGTPYAALVPATDIIVLTLRYSSRNGAFITAPDAATLQDLCTKIAAALGTPT